MKILIVSWYFPPANTIAALRVGKFARFLIERGHDLGVVAGSRWGLPETLPLGAPLERVAYANWFDVNDLPARIQQIFKARRAQGPATPDAVSARGENSIAANGSPEVAATSRSWLRSLLRGGSNLYFYLVNLPDSRIGWFPGTYRAGLRMTKTWRPDLIFASGPPMTALLAASLLSRRLRVPWIAELRDRWADDPYGEVPRWRGALDQWLERRVLNNAAALVTVTEPWAEFYRRKYSKPVATIYNGYDPRDFPAGQSHDGATGDENLIIGYTGGIYPGIRDPTPLFNAIRQLGAAGERVRVVFYGTDPAHVLLLAQRAGVERLVEVRKSIPYQQSLEFQRNADVLLLMQWNDPREQGNCPGKFFEYMASLRPILILGLENGVPATIARERATGVCINDPAAIAAQLRRWLDEKQRLSRLPGPSEAARDGLSRTIQYEKLERFLHEVVP